MNMIDFKQEVKEIGFESLDKAYLELSKLSYLVYLKRIPDKFIFELKNGEIFTMDNEDIVSSCVIFDELIMLDECIMEKVRVAADWKKVEDYHNLSDREKFDFIRHETSLEESLEKLIDLTKVTRGKFRTQRDLIDEIAIIYGYLKRVNEHFEVYIGNDYEVCTIVKLSAHRARTYYKLYHHLHERDNFNSPDTIEVYNTPLGTETFTSLMRKMIKEKSFNS